MTEHLVYTTDIRVRDLSRLFYLLLEALNHLDV
jgi:hypothetical protein